jgi:hypothetical protein
MACMARFLGLWAFYLNRCLQDQRVMRTRQVRQQPKDEFWNQSGAIAAETSASVAGVGSASRDLSHTRRKTTIFRQAGRPFNLQVGCYGGRVKHDICQYIEIINGLARE